MPENEHQKHRLHIPPAPPLHTSVEYAELHVTTNFSFLRGGSHPEEIVTRAAQLGCKAVAVTDINSLAGIVRGRTGRMATGAECERRAIPARAGVGRHDGPVHAGETPREKWRHALQDVVAGFEPGDEAVAFAGHFAMKHARE